MLWIIAAAAVVVGIVAWRLVRGQWKESHEQLDRLPSADVRREWPLPSRVGERVMWCPLLAGKVIFSDTRLDEGELGTVVGFERDGRHPVIAFDGRPNHSRVVDKWGAARVVPGDHRASPTRPVRPSRRTTPKKRR